jgi:small redox-active disulfide protein 2
MKIYKVLGSGCPSCIKTAELIKQQASDLGIEVKVEKVTDMEAIIDYGVMRTPAVVFNEQVIHAGGIPKEGDIQQWILAE